jgi:cytochrome P450
LAPTLQSNRAARGVQVRVFNEQPAQHEDSKSVPTTTQRPVHELRGGSVPKTRRAAQGPFWLLSISNGMMQDESDLRLRKRRRVMGQPMRPFPGSRPLNAQGMRLLPDEEAREFAARFDLVDPPAGFHDDPYPIYHALRTHAPVHLMTSGSMLVSRYADLEAIYKNTALFSSDKTREFWPKFGASPLYDHHTTSLVFNDGPRHTRVRRIMAGAMTPRAIANMEGSVVALVDRLLDAMERRMVREGRVDLIEDFAAAIPVEVIGNMLDIPRDERGPLRDWSLSILCALEPAPSQDQLDSGNRAVRAFLAYLADLIAKRRRQPGDVDKDVLTRLILGEGGKLTEAELLQNCIFILNAGHETTTNLIGNGLVALAEWPGERERLIAGRSDLKAAVEEILRFESSNQLGNRMTTAPVSIGGVDLPKGTSITLLIGAANRDPALFAQPDRLDLGRHPNRHLAFASGPHQCVGMNVARLEGRIALGRFLCRFPGYQLVGLPMRGRRARFRGYLSIAAVLA